MSRTDEPGAETAAAGISPLPLPAPLQADRWEWPMTGRDAELEALRRELDKAREGRRFVLIGGEPGIGKTRLVSEFAGEAHSRGASVLFGRTRDRLAKPYLPFVEAFGHCLEHTTQETLAAAPRELSELARLVPEASDRLRGSTYRKDSPASEQFALFKAALSLLRLVSRETPLVLVLDDLHWADESTLLMLQYLLGGRGEFEGLILATYRPTDLAPDSSLSRTVAQLGREPGFSRIELAGLSDAETLSMLTDLAGRGQHGHDGELATALRRETNGNPLFTAELVRSLLASGGLAEVEGRWRLLAEVDSAPLTPVLADTIAQRVRNAGDSAGEALTMAALCEESFDPELIGRALGGERVEQARIWGSAERAALVQADATGKELRFSHPVVRRALRDGLGEAERAVLKERIAAPGPAGAGAPSEGAAGVLESLGDHWAIRLGAAEMTIRDRKGIRYLARLVASPGVEMHAMDLQGGPVGVAAPSRRAAAVAELNVQGAGSDAGPVLDETAKREYRARVEELEETVTEAEEFNDPERAAQAREELEFIGRELAAAVGLGGRDRKAGSEAERARVNVTRAIRHILDRIAENDEAIGAQLSSAVRTGTFCCFEPLPGQPRWTVRGI